MIFDGVLLRSVAHAEARQISITEGEQDHEDDEESVVVEKDGQMKTRLNVTQHEERNEEQPTTDGHRKYQAVFAGLQHKQMISSDFSSWSAVYLFLAFISPGKSH